jgi:hypothetical protein
MGCFDASGETDSLSSRGNVGPFVVIGSVQVVHKLNLIAVPYLHQRQEGLVLEENINNIVGQRDRIRRRRRKYR